MTVLSRWLNKLKAQPKTLEEQLSELDQLQIEDLALIALEDERAVFRLAATARLDFGATLIKLAYDSGIAGVQQGVQQKARQRLAELADQGAITLDQLAADGVDPMAQLAVVGFCKRDELLEQLLNANSDEVFFYQIALEGVTTKLRQLAAEKIEDEERLKDLLKKTKGKDKRVYKIVKVKCDGFRDRDQLLAQTQVELVSLCERLEDHSKRPFDKSFTVRSQHLQEEWALLQAQAHEPLVARADQAMLECQETIDDFLKQQADVEARELAIAKAAQQQAAIIDKLRAALAHLFDCLATEKERQSTEALLKESRAQWLGAVEYQSARNADEKVFRQLGDGIEFQLQQLQQHGSLIDQLAGIRGLQAEIPAETATDKVNVDAKASNASDYDN
ncbi:MAG: exonuclease SbcC, partial [Candidatus Azotimanducaceae bacterium]